MGSDIYPILGPLDKRRANVLAFGHLGLPIYDAVPDTYRGADIIAVRSGTQPTVTYTYYKWDGSAFVELTGSMTLTQIMQLLTLNVLLPADGLPGQVLQVDPTSPDGFSWRTLFEDTPTSVFTVGPYNQWSLGPMLAAMALPAPASAVWDATANRAHLFPFRLPFTMEVRRFFAFNGATVAGNLDMGIYNSDLRLITATGSTAQAGAINTVSFYAARAESILTPGDYYFTLVSSSNTTTFFSGSPTTLTSDIYGCLMAGSSLPLPTNLVAATATAWTTRFPVAGFTAKAIL